MTAKRAAYIFSAIIAAAYVGLTWLMMGTSSPVVQLFKPDCVPLSRLWGALHFHFAIAFYVLGLWAHMWLFYVLVIVQWFLISIAFAHFFVLNRLEDEMRRGL